MEHRDERFVDEEIHLGDDAYIGCTFEDCRLIYDGSPGVHIKDCDFDETRLELVDAAGNTLSFLQNIYHGFGEDGRLVVESLFENIREGRIGQRSYGDTDGTGPTG